MVDFLEVGVPFTQAMNKMVLIPDENWSSTNSIDNYVVFGTQKQGD